MGKLKSLIDSLKELKNTSVKFLILISILHTILIILIIIAIFMIAVKL